MRTALLILFDLTGLLALWCFGPFLLACFIFLCFALPAGW